MTLSKTSRVCTVTGKAVLSFKEEANILDIPVSGVSERSRGVSAVAATAA